MPARRQQAGAYKWPAIHDSSIRGDAVNLGGEQADKRPSERGMGEKKWNGQDKVDEMTLALLYLVMSDVDGAARSWKGHGWATMNRLHEKGWISDDLSDSLLEGKVTTTCVRPRPLPISPELPNLIAFG